MSAQYRPDELEAQAARAMLTALERIAASDPNNTKFAVLVIAEAREVIAQAKAAGIKAEG